MLTTCIRTAFGFDAFSIIQKRGLATAATATTQTSQQTIPSSDKPKLVAKPLRPTNVHLPLSYFPKDQAIEKQDRVVPLPSNVFDVPYRYDILHFCVKSHLAGLRQGSAHTKKRWEVRGSGRKLHIQKGTGKARVGDGQSPIRVGGGRAHGPRGGRDWSLDVPDKIASLGMRNALSLKWKFSDLVIVDRVRWPLNLYSTNQLARELKQYDLDNATFIVRHAGRAFHKSIANLPNVEAFSANNVHTYGILKRKKLVMDLFSLEDMLKKHSPTEFKGSHNPVTNLVKEALQHELDCGLPDPRLSLQQDGLAPSQTEYLEIDEQELSQDALDQLDAETRQFLQDNTQQ